MMETGEFTRAVAEGREMAQRVLDRMRDGELLGVVWFFLVAAIAPEFKNAVQDENRGRVIKMRDDYVAMAERNGWYS